MRKHTTTLMSFGLLVSSILAVSISLVLCRRTIEWEFSPDLFQHRQLERYYIPFTDYQICTRSRESYRDRLCLYLIDKEYLKPSDLQTHQAKWDMVTAWSPCEKGNMSGSAKMFWYHAGCKTKDECDAWIRWSNENPALARRLWPIVISQIKKRGENYHLAAELMRLVDKCPDKTSFDRAYTEWQKYVDSHQEKKE